MTTTAKPSAYDRAARIVTEVCAPGILVVVILIAVGWYTSPGFTGVGWGLLSALFCGIAPYAILIAGAKLGWWSDHHVGDRKQRLVPLVVIIACVVGGIAALAVLDAPNVLLALVVTMLATLVITLLITAAARWKISVHAAVAGGVSAILMLTYGPAMAVTLPAVALVAWSRVHLRDHTIAQVAAGSALGIVFAGALFQILS